MYNEGLLNNGRFVAQSLLMSNRLD